ncbi:MAG: apolipoprotein N-acyltransferase [Acidobacteria bacterium]|nr:apolipoprotein N-acyltransferase [Acidobacteriota bacterium]
MLALSFPRYGQPVLALVALAPLFVALSGWRGRPGVCPGVSTGRGFLLGLLTGLVHFAGTVYWIGETVQTFGGLGRPVAVLVAGLLVLYMATFVALAGAASALVIRRHGARGLVLAPFAWVATEYLRGHLFGGFPWIPLGNAVVTLLPIAQLASVVGVYGVSLYLASINAAFAFVLVATARDRLKAAAVATALVAAGSIWGGARLSASVLTTAGTPVRIGVVQGNVPQEEKWDRSRAGAILSRYLSMTREVAKEGVDVVMWPESATPFYFDEDPAGAAAVRALSRELATPILFGTDEVERRSPDRYFNSAFVLDRAGATAAVYRKIHLVPFGEYVPFQQALFFVAPLVDAVSNFSAGTRVTLLPIAGHMASTAICYEVVYPHLIREGVLNGSELLTTITNDAWYGRSSAPFQHFELAAMRAIEQGRYLARAANTGISGFVDPYGRVLSRTRLFETTTLVGEVRFLQQLTLYARIGDLTAQIAVLVTLLSIAGALWSARPS